MSAILDFAKKYGVYAVQASGTSGIFPQTILTAAALESGYAKSLLASKYNNFFGIKAGASWKGERVVLPTKEHDANGNVTTVNAAFRVYPSPADSFKNYVSLLTNLHYTSFGVSLASTPVKQFEAIKKAGYATDVNYVKLLTAIYNGVPNWAAIIPLQYLKKKLTGL